MARQRLYLLCYQYLIGFGKPVARQRRIRVYWSEMAWYVCDPRDGELMFFHRWEDAVAHAGELAREIYPHRVFGIRRGECA